MDGPALGGVEGNLRVVKLLAAVRADLNVRESGHNGTPAGVARAAIEVTNNPAWEEVAEYLDGVQRAE